VELGAVSTLIDDLRLRLEASAVAAARLYASPDPTRAQMECCEAVLIEAGLAFGRAVRDNEERRLDQLCGGARVVPEAER
jgi:hypothetical protein